MAREVAEILVGWGKLDAQALDRAVNLQRASGERVDVILTRLGLAAEADVARARASHLDLPLAEPGDYPAEPVLADQVSIEFLRRARVLPLADRPDGLILAMADPLDRYALDAIQPTPAVEIHPDDLAALGLADGATVAVISRRGRIVLEARATRRVSRGSVFIPFHFREAAANLLTSPVLEPHAKMAALKVCAVRIESDRQD